jgi:ABC-type lipoprotein release transport system permease subunit
MMILRTLKHQPLHGYALAQHIKSTSRDLLQVEEDRSTPPYNAYSRMPWSLAVAAANLLFVAAAAGFIPATRASRISPISALRSE